MFYAPVAITTLDRNWHLRQCLESLSRCTWADKTEVYVALDYPPEDKWERYAPGWEKNKEYLHSVGNMGFKQLHIIERDHNYGTWNPGDEGNMKQLLIEIRKKYDRYIVTEDDNVFAPAFLEYMDKGLELFENDEKVLSITGYRLYFTPPVKFEGNTYARQCVDYITWGIGCWTNKGKNMPLLDYKWHRKQLTIKKLRYLRKKVGLGAVCQLVNRACATKRTIIIDVDRLAYMALEDKQQIFPKQTLVHNIGFDGSGASMGDRTGQEWCDPKMSPLPTDEHFEFIGTGYENYEENQRIYSKGKYFKTDWQYRWILLKKLMKLIVHWRN
ncbi:MAG: hypothetical protein II862_05995 [Bacteroidales bacterium]|nr:hypothetical protein [Bacteroidales bacterium]